MMDTSTVMDSCIHCGTILILLVLSYMHNTEHFMKKQTCGCGFFVYSESF